MPIGNNSIFGAFTLSELHSGRLTGEWLNTDVVANYGWFAGGANFPAQFSSIDRINFSNDTVTATQRTPLSSSRYGVAAVGNSNYGWFGGGTTGLSPSNISSIQRMDFSNDLGALPVRSPLSSVKWSLEGTGNSNYGWFGGGIVPAATTSIVERIDFSNDSLGLSVRGPLSLARAKLGSTSNLNYGWFGGSSTSSSLVDRIDFSNDFSIASPRGSLILTGGFSRATGNSNYGWFAGSTGSTSTVNRINFANDLATSSIRGPLSAARYGVGATGNSNYGWFGGGSSPRVSRVDRIDFSNDSVIASVRGSLTSARYNIGATSGVLNIRRQKAGNFGWFGGGLAPATPAPLIRSTVDRIDFANDSVAASVRGPLSQARDSLAATGNSNYGWFGGGRTPTPARLSTVDRIDFSNDAATASPRGSLSFARSQLAATGNSNYGWWGGGYGDPAPGLRSTVDRIDFSNDSTTASVRGPLGLARYTFSATGNSNYGWFGGGDNPALGPYPSSIISRVDRIDFSNDSATASVRGPLTSAKYWMGATGNSNYGWFGGGFSTSPAPGVTASTVDRIDFSNDSATASPRGNLISARRNVHATGNSNYGWFSGDFSPSILSVVDRINFSNDTATASPRGPLSVTRFGFTATSNTPIG
jgi:hypothetical protein